MTEPAWKNFETLIEDLQRAFHPTAVVTRNERIRGRNSESLREIDILIRQKLGIHDLLIIVDCKRRTRKVDVCGVSQFAELKDDVGAHLGLLVTEKGFTRGARNLAQRREITLLTFRDTHRHGWNSTITMPLLVEYWNIIPMIIRIKHSDGTHKDIQSEAELELTDRSSGRPLHIIDILRHCCSREKDLREGNYAYEFSCGDSPDQQDLTLHLGFRSKREFYFDRVKFGFFGLQDDRRNIFHTQALSTPRINIDDVRHNWPRVKDFSKLPKTCLCLRAYDMNPEVPNLSRDGDGPGVRFKFQFAGVPISLPTNLDLELSLSSNNQMEPTASATKG